MAAEASRAPSVRERTTVAATWRRFINKLEPWYNWGAHGILRVDDRGEGAGGYFAIDWLGLHLTIVVGRTPPVQGDRT